MTQQILLMPEDLISFNSQDPNLILNVIEKARIASGEPTFFPEFHGKGSYEYWLNLRNEGFEAQGIPGLKRGNLATVIGHPYNEDYTEGFIDSFDIKKIVKYLAEGIEPLEYQSEQFPFTFQVTKMRMPSSRVHFNGDFDRKDIFGLSIEDMIQPAKKENNPLIDNYHRYRNAYCIGEFQPHERPSDQRELIMNVFRINPSTDDKLQQALTKIYGLKEDKSIRYGISWIDSRDLTYNLSETVFDVYMAVKRSRVFERLEFGSLYRKSNVSVDDKSKTVVSFLAGIYQEFRIPLCHWK